MLIPGPDTDPIFGESGKFLDQNAWVNTNASKTAISWLHTLTEKPEILVKTNTRIPKDLGYLTAFNANYGTWNRKHLFLAAALKQRVRSFAKRLLFRKKTIIFYRDPNSRDFGLFIRKKSIIISKSVFRRKNHNKRCYELLPGFFLLFFEYFVTGVSNQKT